jgi:hypothetical protein
MKRSLLSLETSYCTNTHENHYHQFLTGLRLESIKARTITTRNGKIVLCGSGATTENGALVQLIFTGERYA